MPIPTANINTAILPRILTPAATVEELLRLFRNVPRQQRAFTYAVVRVGDGSFDVLTLDDLSEPAGRHGSALLPMRLADVPGLLRPAAPLYQARTGEDAGARAVGNAPRRCLVVLDENDQILGVWGEWRRGRGVVNPLALLETASPPIAPALPTAIPKEPLEAAGDEPPTAAEPRRHALNTRFDGIGPDQLLPVGRRVPLIIWVGLPQETNEAQSSRPFEADLSHEKEPVMFKVDVDADPAMWSVKAAERTMIVAPDGTTLQEAEYLITAKQPGRDKFRICIERADTGVAVQHVWLAVEATADSERPAEEIANLAARRPPPAASALARVEATLPLNGAGLERRKVEITVQPDEQSFLVVVRADLPAGTVRETHRLPVSVAEVQNAVLSLRQELEKIVLFQVVRDGKTVAPFLDLSTLAIDPALARKTAAPLADAGEQIWRMLFGSPRTPSQLRQLAADIRALPEGSSFQVVLDSQQFALPWALLYDKPGPINADTLDWAGFWGYRYILDTLPPGRYPPPAIAAEPPGILLMLNDDAVLEQFTEAQAQFATAELGGAQARVAWGDAGAQQMFASPGDATLVYCYCQGDNASGAERAGDLPGNSRIAFSRGRGLRLADLRRIPAAPLSGRPLVFLNACEGATRDAFFYDGFMPFFIEELGARAFIGAEVKVPQHLAHDAGLRFLRGFAAGVPVSEILWRLRRYYLDAANNILAFSYSLYGSGDSRLARALAAAPVL